MANKIPPIQGLTHYNQLIMHYNWAKLHPLTGQVLQFVNKAGLTNMICSYCYNTYTAQSKNFEGETFVVVQSTGMLSCESMAMPIGNISIQACFSMKVFPQVNIFLSTHNSSPQKLCLIW